jgi:hypothetical protein
MDIYALNSVLFLTVLRRDSQTCLFLCSRSLFPIRTQHDSKFRFLFQIWVRGQLDALATLFPGKEPTGLVRAKTDWASKAVWIHWWGREEYSLSARDQARVASLSLDTYRPSWTADLFLYQFGIQAHSQMYNLATSTNEVVWNYFKSEVTNFSVVQG